MQKVPTHSSSHQGLDRITSLRQKDLELKGILGDSRDYIPTTLNRSQIFSQDLECSSHDFSKRGSVFVQRCGFPEHQECEVLLLQDTASPAVRKSLGVGGRKEANRTPS